MPLCGTTRPMCLLCLLWRNRGGIVSVQAHSKWVRLSVPFFISQAFTLPVYFLLDKHIAGCFFFRPPVHFQKHGNPPTKVGPIVVGKSHVILPFEEEGKGRCRGVLTFRRTVPARAGDGVSWATDATPAPFARHSGSHGQTGAELLEGSMTEKKWLFLCHRHIKIQQAAESMAGQRPVSFPAL